MIYDDLGFNIDSLEYGLIRKKTNILTLLFFIFFVTFLMVLLPFSFFWVLKVPIEINEVNREYWETDYQNFMIWYHLILGLLILLSGIFTLVFFKRKPFDYIIINKDNNLNNYLQINTNKNRSLYVNDEKCFFFSSETGKTEEITDPIMIDSLLNKYVFWHRWNKINDYKIKKLNKKTILSFKVKVNGIVYVYRYRIICDYNNLPTKITETVGVKSNSRTSSIFMTYYLENLNRPIHSNLDKRALDKLTD
ncbi:MAG: hypothetical protein PHF05_06805 [Candidatus Izemoplasmatales bacterium]|nr:hypothetical protein [Candidatus Izemoplasmatales bacterium]